MRVAVLTDLPFLYYKSMYLSELETRMRSQGLDLKVFIIRTSNFFQRFDSKTGFIRMITATKLLRELNKFDIIHIQFTYPLGTVVALLSWLRLFRKPILVHTHGYDVFNISSIDYGLQRNTFGKIAASLTWKQAERIIAVCKKAKDEISSIIANDDKIELLYNGIDERLFTSRKNITPPSDIKAIRQENDLLFLSTASLVPVKNHSRLIASFERLADMYKSKYKMKLLLIGSNQSGKIHLTDSQHVIYLGQKDRDALPMYYSSADVFILPSISEAHPWAMLEAMSCELVVIGSNVGGISETLHDSRFLVDPFDTDDMVKKMSDVVLLSGNERAEIGSSNRKQILKSFTLTDHINRLKIIYQKIL